MNEVLSKDIKKLEKGFDSIEQEKPYLKPVVASFKEVVISRAILKSRLSDHTDLKIPSPEYSRLAEGHPWLTEEAVASFIEPWGELVESTMPPLARAFPGITANVLKLREAFKTGNIDLKQCIGFLVEGKEEDIIRMADYVGSKSAVLKFILGQMLKPFVEKRIESLRPLVENIPWHEGYCPICGAFPEVGFLKDEAGERWLKCSLCGYDWRFDKMACPYCGERKGSIESICIVDNEHEWVELCHDCHRYIVGIDLRRRKGITADVATIGAVNLDIIAQSKGFLPVAECAWNMVPPGN
jgi:FdhE protein